MNRDRQDAIAASEPLTKKLHEPTPAELIVSAIGREGVVTDSKCTVFSSGALTTTDAPVTIADSSTLAAALEYVKTWHDWLDTCVTREAAELPPAVLTRYQDALTVMEEAEKDLRCADCEVAPITMAILNRELPRFVCDACFEKENA